MEIILNLLFFARVVEKIVKMLQKTYSQFFGMLEKKYRKPVFNYSPAFFQIPAHKDTKSYIHVH